MTKRKVFVRSPYNYDADVASLETGLLCEDESRTVQSEAKDSDINEIVRRFGVTGVLPQGVRVPSYGDFASVIDFQSAQNVIVAAREAFDAMPSSVRNRFDNDAGRFMDFCHDPANLDEMIKMGLAVPRETVDITPPPEDVPPEITKEKSRGSTKGKSVQRSGKDVGDAGEASD